MNTFITGCKSMFWFTALILFTGIISGCWTPGPLEGHVKITEQTTFFMEDTSANPLPFKVAVYKTEFSGGPAYLVTYNYVNRGDICPLGAIWGSKEEYDMAYFNWEHDTTVMIRLYNSETGIQEEFKLFGVPSSNGSGMEIIDDEE